MLVVNGDVDEKLPVLGAPGKVGVKPGAVPLGAEAVPLVVFRDAVGVSTGLKGEVDEEVGDVLLEPKIGALVPLVGMVGEPLGP